MMGTQIDPRWEEMKYETTITDNIGTISCGNAEQSKEKLEEKIKFCFIIQ